MRFDQRILDGVLACAGLPLESLHHFLKADAIRDKRRSIRTRIRKRMRKSKNGRKAKRACRPSRRGHMGVMPPNGPPNVNARITSAETDGVGLAMSFSWNAERDAVRTRQAGAKLLDREAFRVLGVDAGDVFPAANDAGRCNMSQVAWKDSTGTHQGRRLTRTSYYRRALIDRGNQKYARHLTATPDLRRAHRALAEDTWKTTDAHVLSSIVDTVNHHSEALERERVSKRGPLQLMLQWRRKKSVKDQYAASIVRDLEKERRIQGKQATILGYGNGTFSHTGKGEKSVPTKDMLRRIILAFKRARIKGGVVSVNEAYTTQVCHGCHQRTVEIKDENGYVIRDKRHCVGPCAAGKPNGVLVRNRDKNAAINILDVLKAWLAEDPHPEYLTRDYWRAKRGVDVVQST